MLKIAVFDSGFGGELFADRLESELPVVEVIRVIDWRSAKEAQKNPYSARRFAEQALRPYLGKVDLIIMANYLLATTSLKYFRRKYSTQKFVGFTIKPKRIAASKPTLIITTKAITRNLAYSVFAHRIKARTICLDSWPLLIDDGDLTSEDIKRDLAAALNSIHNFTPKQILLACGQFTDLTADFRQVFGHNVRIVDSFDQTIEDACRTLRLKGYCKKQ